MGGASIGIVGGGIAGLTCAYALRRAGHDVTVFESADSLRDGGGALILWPNALSTLRRLGLRDAALRAPSAHVVTRGEFCTPDGELLASIPIGEVGEKHGAESVVIARKDLLNLLAAAANPILLNADVRAVRNDGTKAAVVRKDGTTATFDAVIGADGLNSMVRAAIGASPEIRHVGQELWVGTADFAPAEVSGGTVTATLGVGRRFWTTLLGTGDCFWYAVVRTDLRIDDQNALADLYAGWHSPIERLVRETKGNHVFRTPMRDREPCARWGEGRITLIGDAAHAMTPDLGQGACQAIESGAALADCLENTTDIPAALRAYEQGRFARAADITRMSWLVANACGSASPTAGKMRNAAIRFGMRATFMTQLDWLFSAA